MQAIAALPCATAAQLGYGCGHCKDFVARRITPRLGLHMGSGGRPGVGELVVRSKQPDVEQEKEKELSNFDMPKRVGIKEKKVLESVELAQLVDDEGRRVERMFSNLNEVSLKHEPGMLTFPRPHISELRDLICPFRVHVVPISCAYRAHFVHVVLMWGMLTGNLVSAVLLIAGTTVGAGILAIPSVTQDSGFLASSVACIACWLYMVRHLQH